MTPESIYDSAWQQPRLLGGLGFAALLYVVAAIRGDRAAWSPFLRSWAVVWAVEIIADAWLTSSYGPLRGGLARAAAIAFVIAGDLRCFLLVERLISVGHKGAAILARSVAWSFVASLVVAAATRLAPDLFGPTRHVFLLYEIVSLGLFAAWWARLARRDGSPEVSLARAAVGFFLVQYALWAGSDIAILAGVRAAFIVRIVPNVLYYGVFVAWVLRRAPRSLRA